MTSEILSFATAAPLLALILASCGGAASSARGPGYPARSEGCAIKVFHDAPSMPTDNIGPIQARCGFDVSEADCLRMLEDEACKLGADVVWGVAEKPEVFGDRNVWNARAARAKSAGLL